MYEYYAVETGSFGETQTILNKYAEEGWELVVVDNYILYFKRMTGEYKEKLAKEDREAITGFDPSENPDSPFADYMYQGEGEY